MSPTSVQAGPSKPQAQGPASVRSTSISHSGNENAIRQGSHSQRASRGTSLSDISYIPNQEDVLDIGDRHGSYVHDARAPGRFPSVCSCERANATPMRSTTSLELQNWLIPVTPTRRPAPSADLIPSDRPGPAIPPLDIHSEHVAITRMQESRDHDYGCGMGLSRVRKSEGSSHESSR
jgi:hypothetical protein